MIYVFVIFTVIFIAVIEVFTILFQLTGLSKSKARFQVISILTGTGFTTKESELITSSKIRRTFAQIIMIFGFTSTATVVTILVNFISSIRDTTLFDLLFLVASFLGIYIFLRLSKTSKKLDKIIEKTANRLLFGKDSNIIVVKDSYDNNVVVAEVSINKMPEGLKDKTLENSKISNEGIIILAIVRGERSITNANKDTILKIGDTITLFGPLYTINNIFHKSLWS